MAYPSTGEAAAVGFERGIQISRGLREDEERRKQREEERGLRKRQLEIAEEERRFQRGRQVRADEVAEEERALKALEAEYAAARDAFGGLWQSGVRDARLREAGARLEQIGAARSAAMRKRAAPIWQEATDNSKALLSDLEKGRKTPENVEPTELYKAMSVALKRPVSELFRAQDGSPSQLGAAADQLVEAMQSGDERSMLQAANVVFAPELQVGVGEVGRGGAEVVKKEIVAVSGDPRGNGRVMPTLLVTVRLPTGETRQYHAPITEGRATRGEDDRVVSLDVGDVLDHVARIQAAEKVVNSPEARKYLVAGEQAALPDVERYLQAYFAAGGKEFAPKELKTETINLGDRVIRIKTERGGKETREEFKTGIPPRAELDAETRMAIAELRATARTSGAGGGGTAGAEEKRLRIIRNYAKEKGISEEEASKRLRELSVLGVQSPEEREAAAAARAERAATEADVRAGQRQAPGTAPSQVRIETELKAKALRDKSLPAGAKLGKYVVGKGLQVFDDKGKQIGWYRE